MNKLSKFLLMGLLEQESKITALYGGGFKPPTKGHFKVVKQALEQHPEIDKFYVVVGSGLRNNISQDESYSIWNIYKKYLPNKVEIVKAQSPLSYIKNYLEENPDSKTYAVVGTRIGDENDIKDFTQRKEFFEKYGKNVEVLNIETEGGISGTKAREATQSKEEFFKYLPDELSEDEKDLVFDYVKSIIREDIQPTETKNEYPTRIKSLTEYMVNQGMNIKPLPKVRFVNNDHENAGNFFGKTAYYDPNQRLIVLYILNRHPKDVMRSFAHEMIHHMQNCEGRLDNINTSNTNEDGALPEIEREAYEKGNMCFRNWEDSLKNPKQTINEGRYDKISNTISSQILNQWKQDFENGSSESRLEDSFETEDIMVDVDANISFIPGLNDLTIDGGAESETDYLEIRFEVDPELLPKMWSEISMNLKDVVRHEIEHLTHGEGFNLKSGKFMEDDQLIRNIIDAKMLPKAEYFKLEKEIDANLQGMYFRAKKEKLLFIDVINDYLSAQNVTPQEKEEILDLWRERAKALSLPKF